MCGRKARQLQPAGEPELSEDICKVVFDGTLADKQLLAYLFIGMASSNHGNNILFSHSKLMPHMRRFCLMSRKEIAQHLAQVWQCYPPPTNTRLP